MGNIFKRKKQKDKKKLLLVLGLNILSAGSLIYSILAKYDQEPAKKPNKLNKPPIKKLSQAKSPGLEEEIVASNQSDKYHKPSCRYAKIITKDNIINFQTKENAEQQGYQPCGVCHELD